MSEEKYVHTINLEIPMDFWYSVETLLIKHKMKTGKKTNKKNFVLKLIEEGHNQVEKELDKKPKEENGGWKTDAS